LKSISQIQRRRFNLPGKWKRAKKKERNQLRRAYEKRREGKVGKSEKA